MSGHQIIYTSCKRGMFGAGDGQQIFSFDKGLENPNDTAINNLFGYNTPSLPKGDDGVRLAMTDELAKTMPQAFTYRSISDESCAFALNTYLGRDYMGSEGRFGNTLSHVVLFDKEEIGYPCEYFGSKMLRESMSSDEVNKSERPEYLPEPVLEKGENVSFEAVCKFLSDNADKLNIFLNMLAAFMKAETAKKRILICDKRENIIKWIAAIEYVFPAENIKSVSFTTYEYNPETSHSIICGVESDGTKFDPAAVEKFYIFDLQNGNYPEMNIENSFFDFAANSYKELGDFHKFLKGCSWKKADEEIFEAYSLYRIFTENMDELDSRVLHDGGKFLKLYGSKEEKKKFMERLAESEPNIYDQDENYYFDILKFVAENLDFDEEIGKKLGLKLALDRTADEFEYGGKDGFYSTFKRISEICASAGLEFKTEILKEDYFNILISLLSPNFEAWKKKFLISSIAETVKQYKLPESLLEKNFHCERLIYNIFKHTAENKSSDLRETIHILLYEFKDRPSFVLAAAFSAVEMLSELGEGQSVLDEVWAEFTECVYENCGRDLDSVCAGLAEKGYNSKIYDLYIRFLKAEENDVKRFDLLKRLYGFFMKDDILCYRDLMFKEYYNSVFKDGAGSAERAYELYELLEENNLRYDYLKELINKIEEGIALVPSKNGRDMEYLKVVREYCDREETDCGGRVKAVLLWREIKKAESLEKTLENIKHFGEDIKKAKIDIGDFDKKEICAYFGSIIKNICRYVGKGEDKAFKAALKMFKPYEEAAELFCEECTKYYLSAFEKNKDREIFIYYIRFITDMYAENEDKLKKYGEKLKNAGGRNISKIDKLMKDLFENDADRIKLWHIMAGISEDDSGSKKPFGGLFGRFKKNKQ